MQSVGAVADHGPAIQGWLDAPKSAAVDGWGKLYHDPGIGNSQVLTLGGKRVDISGDTARMPEMKSLIDIDIAFVTMHPSYTMPPEEATECIKAFNPESPIPTATSARPLNNSSGPWNLNWTGK